MPSADDALMAYLLQGEILEQLQAHGAEPTPRRDRSLSTSSSMICTGMSCVASGTACCDAKCRKPSTTTSLWRSGSDILHSR